MLGIPVISRKFTYYIPNKNTKSRRDKNIGILIVIKNMVCK